MQSRNNDEDVSQSKELNEASDRVSTNQHTLFKQEQEWKWGVGIEPSQELVEEYAKKVPTRGFTRLRLESN